MGLESLLGRAGDPKRDREALLILGEADDEGSGELAARLIRDRAWRSTALGELLPGLGLTPSALFWGRLGGRARGRLRAAGIDTTWALAAKSPTGIRNLPEVGAKISVEIVRAALGSWAAAHLEVDGRPEAAVVKRPARATSNPRGLIGRLPDPSRDEAPLRAFRDRGNPAVEGLLEDLCEDTSLRELQLDELFPGLALLGARPGLDRLGVHAANRLGRAGIDSLQALARLSPLELEQLDGVGRGTALEILALAAGEWAACHLRGTAEPDRWDDGKDPLRAALGTLSAWAEATGRAQDALAATTAAARQRRPLPPPVERALDELRQFSPAGADGRRHGLAAAFEELEAKPSFASFRARQLEPAPRPSARQLGAEVGVSHQAIFGREANIEARLRKSMRRDDWPIRIAVEDLRARLGAVALPWELPRALARIDGGGGALGEGMAHRRALLIRLAEYRVGEEWVLGPDIESLTDVVLTAVWESEERGPDAVARHLTALGVREEMQPAWIFSRPRSRIAPGISVGQDCWA